MKHLSFALAAPLAILLTSGLTACGDDVTEVTETAMTSVETEAELPACGAYNNGTFVITNDKQKVFVCYSEKWFTLNGNDGSPAQIAPADTAASSSNKALDGKKGADGKNGANGTSCTGVAFERNDSTGFKIVCGTDTLGVVLNGNDGTDGRNGNHGLIKGLAYKLAKRMKRGINSMAFYNPGKEFKGFSDDAYISDWSAIEYENRNRLRKSDFKMVADQGFDHIRIVVKWDTHFVGDSSKCNIDPEWMKQVRWAVENTNAAGMIAVVDDHGLLYEMESSDDFTGNGYTYEQVSPCEKNIYRQIIEAMKDISPDSLIVELSNEPTLAISAKQWNNLADSLIQIIHGVDPARVIIVGSRNLYSRDYLDELQLDNSDGLLIASFHYYEPFSFALGGCGAKESQIYTADKAIWADSCGNGVWSGTTKEKMTVYSDFEQVAQWSRAHGNIPIYLGEFGVRGFVKDTVSTEKWLSTVSQTADYFGFATAVFSLDSDTHLYYFLREQWFTYKLRALFNPQSEYVAPERPNLDTVSKTTVLEDFGTNFPASKLSSDLNKKENWGIYNTCNGNSACTTVVSTNASGTRIEVASMASFKTDDGYNGDGIYVKHEVDAPENVDPYFSLQTRIASSGTSSPAYFDFTNMKAMSFYAKGQGRIRIVFISAYSDSIARANNAEWAAGFYREFALSTEWKRYVVWFDALFPEPYSVLEEKDGDWNKAKKKVYEIQVKPGYDVYAGTKSTVEWYLDDFTIHGMSLSDFQ